MASTQSDLSEDIEVPRPKIEKNSSNVSLKKIENFYLTTSENQETIAIVKYPIRKDEEAWDNLDLFAESLDTQFFKPFSKKSIVAGAFCALFGAIVPHPSCGYVIKNVGDFLHVPLSGGGSDAMVAWLTISTTPVFAQQSFKLGQAIFRHIVHDHDLSDTVKDDDSKPYVFHKTKAHYASKGALIISSFVNAGIPLILMRDAERKFPIFFAITAIPFWSAWVENYYAVGSRGIDHLFEYYRYVTKINFQKRDILKKKILGFKDAMNANDSLTKDLFKAFKVHQENQFKAQKDAPFAFSLFFLRDLNRMEEDEGMGLLINFKSDMDRTPYLSTDDFLEWGSTFLTGAGLYARYQIHQHVLNDLLVELGMPPESSFITSATFSAFESFYRIGAGHYMQRTYFKNLKNMFSLTGNFPFVRKGLGIASAVNGSLFALPNLVAGLHIFKDLSPLSQFAYLAPSFLLDFSYYDSFFNRHYNEFLTNISSFKEKNIGIMGQRAHLNYYADKAYNLISELDVETVEKIYQIVQKGA